MLLSHKHGLKVSPGFENILLETEKIFTMEESSGDTGVQLTRRRLL